MAELEEIAAMVGITVVDTPSGDAGSLKAQAEPNVEGENGDGNNADSQTIQLLTNLTGGLEEVTEDDLEAEFADRYTDTDPDYIENLGKADDIAKPPAYSDFTCRPPRKDNWNRSRDRGGRGGQRGGYHNRDWGHGGGGDNRGYGGGYRDNRQGGYYDNRQGGYRGDDRQGGYRDRSGHRDDRQGYRERSYR